MYLYFKLLILHKWINFVQTLFSGRHQNYLNHQRTTVAEFHYILSQSFISNLSHNTGCSNVVRPFSQPSLRRLADSPQDCHPPRVGESSSWRWYLEGARWAIPVFWSTNAQRMEESCSLLLSSIFFVLDGNGPICF